LLDNQIFYCRNSFSTGARSVTEQPEVGMDWWQAKDEGTLFWFASRHRPWLTPLMEGLSFLGAPPVLLAVAALAAVGFLLAKRPRTACVVLATAVLALGLTYVSKRVVDRPRPDVAWKLIPPPPDRSFPGGRALGSMAVFGSIALTASRGLRRAVARYLVNAAGLGLPLLIGFSRPYLGVDYPGDAIGGWTAGLACALLALWIDERWTPDYGISPGQSAKTASGAA
jgi:undecaprenyl-diphosphatase